VDEAAAGEKRLVDFEMELVIDLAELRMAYERSVQSMKGLCSPMPEGEPTVADYVRWLTTEVTSLPEVFSDVNENLVSAAVEGALVMAVGSVDLAALQASIAVSGADVLPGERDVRKASHAVARKWWHSFSYNSTLAAIQARLREANCCLQCFLVLFHNHNSTFLVLDVAEKG
jgi:hypothetical protein